MSNKRLTLKRLVIFLVISFIPFWIIVPVLNGVYGEQIFVCEEAASAVYALGVFGMLIPSVANLVTRLVTKEGFADSFLGLNFKGNAGYYIASVVVKLAESLLGVIIIWAVFINDLGFSEMFTSENMTAKTGLLLLQLSASIVIFFPAFGEEWGWRGYMMPKLTELIGKPAAIVAGGVIWGLWHAPLTIAGHNFGTDYDLYPWLGIMLMCVMCVFMNAFLTLLTEKTKSIYPASFCHMINNNLGSTMLLLMFGSEAAIMKLSAVSSTMLLVAYMPVFLVTGTVSFILLVKKKK